MSLDQVEVVTKLLRASRNCNELLLKDCFKDILENGITGKDLNSTDKSGRVSLTIMTWTTDFEKIDSFAGSSNLFTSSNAHKILSKATPRKIFAVFIILQLPFGYTQGAKVKIFG